MQSDIKHRMVVEAETYLSAAKNYLEELLKKVQECTNPQEKKKLENSLEQDRIRFAQMYADVVIFKATNGIFTSPQSDPPTSNRLK
jgi:hypothetical protein